MTNCPSREFDPMPCRNQLSFLKQMAIFHPDRNTGCREEATRKWRILGNVCEEFMNQPILENDVRRLREDERIHDMNVMKERENMLEKIRAENFERFSQAVEREAQEAAEKKLSEAEMFRDVYGRGGSKRYRRSKPKRTHKRTRKYYRLY